MPSYDYDCPRCGDFTLIRAIADRDAPAPCPDCRRLSHRAVTAPNLSLMDAGNRQVHQVNEKSRHSPELATRHRCGSGCGCSSRTPQGPPSRVSGKETGAASRTSPIRKGPRRVEVPKLGRFEASSRQSTRPWMLGH